MPPTPKRTSTGTSQTVVGRLVLDGRVTAGRIEVVRDRIESVSADPAGSDGPYVAPGFVDVHVHGWGGHDAMGGSAALDGMAAALLRHGVTSFLPTAVTAPLGRLAGFAEEVRGWSASAPDDGAAPLGFNLEGPCISAAKKGAQNESHILAPGAFADALEPLLDGLRIITVAPELPRALDLIRRLARAGVAVSLGHSVATADEAAAGYLAGARTTTHLFNAMSGVDNHAPGLATAALADDDAYVELVADGLHVDERLWPLIVRTKPRDRLVLVTDAIQLAGAGEGSFELGGLPVVVQDGSCRLLSNGRLAGSIIALDTAVRRLVDHGVPLPDAVRAASRTPLELIGVHDRGRIAPGQRADLVELDANLGVQRVMKAGRWNPGAAAST